MTKEDIKLFKRFVGETLVRSYHMDELEAHRAVRESYLSEALERDHDYVMHDTVEEWAEFVHKETEDKKMMMV